VGGGKAQSSPAQAQQQAPRRRDTATLDQQESRVMEDFQKAYKIRFNDIGLLKLALTHRSYLSVTGQGPRESNERLEFLGDSVLGLVTSEFLYRRAPDEHEGQLTKTKSLLVSKAILSRRALKMGLGRFVLMSHSEMESGGRQRLSILADAFESVLGAVYLDQGFEVARKCVHDWLLTESDAIVQDKRHTNYKSHLQEYVQSTYRTHPVYRIRSENGPDHSKYFMVEVMVGRRTLGEGRGHNKKEAEQAAARDALEKVEKLRSGEQPVAAVAEPARESSAPRDEESGEGGRRSRGRRGGRGRGSEAGSEGGRGSHIVSTIPPVAAAPKPQDDVDEDDDLEDELDEVVLRPGDEAGFEEYEAEEDDIDDTEDEADDDDADDEELAPAPPIARRPEPVVPARSAPASAPVRVSLPATPVMRSASVPLAPSVPTAMPPVNPPPARVEREAASAPAVATPAAVAPAPKPAAAPAAPVYGRGLRPGRRSGPVAPPAPKPEAFAATDGPIAETEERKVDAFEMNEPPARPQPTAIVDVAPAPVQAPVQAPKPRAPEPVAPTPEEDEESEARIEEMERAMADFGQRRDTPPKLVAQRPGYGRKGKRR
jgi:ribonuclease-3